MLKLKSMKLKPQLIHKPAKTIVALLKNKKGELLLESVLSILIFAILMLAVTSMITASFRITTNGLLAANQQQQIVNNLVAGAYNGTISQPDATFTSDNGIKTSIKCTLNIESGYAVFRPNVGGGHP